MLLIIVSIFWNGCSINEESFILHFDNRGLAYDENNNLFTGVTSNFYENGKIKSRNTYLNGVRYGEWKIYGYSGEVIQHGEYMDNKKLGIDELDAFDCERIEVNKWFEGENQFLDIYIVNPKYRLEKSEIDKTIELVSKKRSENVSVYELDYLTSRNM